MSDIHSCGYFCTRPVCVLAQRNELRDKLERSANIEKAAQLVLDRWDSPAWEWITHGPTAALMADLRRALAAKSEETQA